MNTDSNFNISNNILYEYKGNEERIAIPDGIVGIRWNTFQEKFAQSVKVKTAISRLLYPINLDKKTEDKYKKYLSKMTGKIISDFLECADSEEIAYLEELGILSA